MVTGPSAIRKKQESQLESRPRFSAAVDSSIYINGEQAPGTHFQHGLQHPGSPPKAGLLGLRRASRNMGPFFVGKKAPAATYPQARGFQDLGTKKNGELERRSLSKIEQGHGGVQAPARASGRLETPQEQQGVWGLEAPQQKQFYVIILW